MFGIHMLQLDRHLLTSMDVNGYKKYIFANKNKKQ